MTEYPFFGTVSEWTDHVMAQHRRFRRLIYRIWLVWLTALVATGILHASGLATVVMGLVVLFAFVFNVSFTLGYLWDPTSAVWAWYGIPVLKPPLRKPSGKPPDHSYFRDF